MPSTTHPTGVRRTELLRQSLIERRQTLQNELHDGIERGRQRLTQGADDLEHSEADVQSGMSIALIEMQSATLARVDAALGRLDTGQYGQCLDCDREITASRLQALPFALRCQVCEGKREAKSTEERRLAERRGSLTRSSARPAV
jgi:DnaK suppressor protein